MNSQNTDRDLLIAALNKNQVTYSQVSKIAEELINGVLKLKTLPMEKEFVFEYMNKKVYIDLNALRIGGLKYLNNILIDDILTTVELNEVYKILDQLKNELLNKADKIHKHDIADVNNLQSALNDKADLEHTHTTDDIVDYEPYDDTELRTLINSKSDKEHTHDDRYTKLISYPTIEDMIIEWSNIPNNSIIVTNQGADQWSSTFTFKGSLWRSLTFTVPKITQNYLWTRFQGDGDPWTTPSPWRKIPLLDLDSKLIPDMLPNHKHTLSDITDYKAYDDTELRTLINGKADKVHKHAINDLNDVVTNIDSQFEYRIADLTLVTNPYSWGEKDKLSGAYQPSWQIIDKHTIKITMYQETEQKPNLRIVLDNVEETVVHNIEYKLNDYWIPVINYRGYEVYTNNATIDLSPISFNGNFGHVEGCRFSFQQNGRFYTTGAFRVYKNRTTEIVKPDLSLLSTMEAMINLLYPIGSIYTSMNNINPSNFLGGTWKQIVDKFLYCANTSLVEGGSKKITTDNLPPHNHSFDYKTAYDKRGYPDGWKDTNLDGSYWRYGDAYEKTTTNSTGSGTDYMPPYITVFAWYRTG